MNESSDFSGCIRYALHLPKKKSPSFSKENTSTAGLICWLRNDHQRNRSYHQAIARAVQRKTGMSGARLLDCGCGAGLLGRFQESYNSAHLFLVVFGSEAVVGDYGRYHHHGEWVMSLTRGWLVISCFVFVVSLRDSHAKRHGRKTMGFKGIWTWWILHVFTYGAGVSTPMEPENFIEMQRLKGEFSLQLIQKLFRFIPKTGESADLGISTYRHSISNFWSLIYWSSLETRNWLVTLVGHYALHGLSHCLFNWMVIEWSTAIQKRGSMEVSVLHRHPSRLLSLLASREGPSLEITAVELSPLISETWRTSLAEGEMRWAFWWLWELFHWKMEWTWGIYGEFVWGI